MDRQAAGKLIRDTFEKPFDKAQFTILVKNLFNHLDTSDPFTYRGNLVPDAYETHVSALERVGQYRDPDYKEVEVLVVRLKKEGALERARTMQRNFIAWYLNGSRQGAWRDAALAAFVPPSGEDWRFSLVKMNYALESPAGKTKVKQELTPPRRWSFLVGAGERSHTAQRQLAPLLEEDGQDPSLARLEEAFNIEAVTKEFYEKYRDLFVSVKLELDRLVEHDFRLRDEFASKGVDSVNFAKKLLGQIVFLYFLQKKGWFGVRRDGKWGEGSKQFLRELFEGKHGHYHNFFNDVLENLFYEALRYERGNDQYYGQFKCRIPFLNGGLFDPINNYAWDKVDILLPNKLFSNDEKTKEGDTGAGILDVFDRYNFTVQEDEPFDKEVALDPELLGKTYEKFNAIRPDNFDEYLKVRGKKGEESKFNKEYGVYYTPREVVQYMCQESLISYLDNALNTGDVPLVREKPTNLRLMGAPATHQWALTTPGNTKTVPCVDIEEFVRLGEGAIEHDARVISRGEETEKYKFKLPESIRWNARLIDDKLAEVRICDPAIGSGAFPVGLMTEIVRARETITTYLPDKSGRTRYAFKRNAIENSLYGVDIDPGAVEIAKLRLWLSLVVDEDDIRRIEPLPNLDFKIVRGDSLLKCAQDLLHWPLIQELEALKADYLRDTSARKAEHKEKITGLLRQIKGESNEFNFTVDFSEVFPNGVDTGGFDIVIANPPYIRQEKLIDRKPQLKRDFQGCFHGMADIYVYFYERGRQILKKGGTLTFISSNKYFRSGYGENLRRVLACNCRVCQIIDFGDAPVFEAIAYPSIIVLKNSEPDANEVKVFTWPQDARVEGFATTVRSRSQTLAQKELTGDGWRLESPAVLRLLEKLRKAGTPLGEYVKGRFYRGILTGLNEAFVVDRATRDRLIAEHPSSAEVLKPFLRGKDVKRWRAQPQDLWLIFSRRGIDVSKYPAIHRHLLQYKERLTPGVPGGRKPGSYKWYEIQDNIAYWQEFEQPKIVYPDIYEHQSFAFDDIGYYSGNTTYFIPTRDQWLCGLFNSRVIEWFYSLLSNRVRGGYMRSFSDYMEQVPIPLGPEKTCKDLGKAVGHILAAKSANPNADVSDLEHQIDQMVYRLYGLTREEIALVEGSVRQRQPAVSLEQDASEEE